MLFEIEQKVAFLSELSVHSESLLLEGRAETKGEAEQLTLKLRSLKDSLMELQQMLQDKQVDIQVKSGHRERHRLPPAFVRFSALVPLLCRSCCIMQPFVKRINGSIVLTAKVMSRPFVKSAASHHGTTSACESHNGPQNNKQKDASSSQASTECAAADVKRNCFAFYAL